jgi:hypothetical protein
LQSYIVAVFSGVFFDKGRNFDEKRRLKTAIKRQYVKADSACNLFLLHCGKNDAATLKTLP